MSIATPGNKPYVKVYDKKAITPENPKGLTNPIGPEGYLHQYPSVRDIKRRFKPQTNNCRKGRYYLQVVTFLRDEEGTIVKNSPADMKVTVHTRTIEHKNPWLINKTRGAKDYTTYYTPEELKVLNADKKAE